MGTDDTLDSRMEGVSRVPPSSLAVRSSRITLRWRIPLTPASWESDSGEGLGIRVTNSVLWREESLALPGFQVKTVNGVKYPIMYGAPQNLTPAVGLVRPGHHRKLGEEGTRSSRGRDLP